VVINQFMEGKFEGAGLKLLFKVDNNHSALVVAVFFEVWHSIDPLCDAEFYQKSAFFWEFLYNFNAEFSGSF
jgi:hypothetical protein